MNILQNGTKNKTKKNVEILQARKAFCNLQAFNAELGAVSSRCPVKLSHCNGTVCVIVNTLSPAFREPKSKSIHACRIKY